MRIIDFIVHPDYFIDGQKSLFLKGNDIAFAVVEIPYEKYRSMPDVEKKAFQTSLDLPEPDYFDGKDLVKDTNDVAFVAGYPAFVYN